MENNLGKGVEKREQEFRDVNDNLKASEDRYHKMIEEVQDYAIILLDITGVILNWNKGAEKIKQYTAEEIIGKHFSIFYLPEDKKTNLPQRLIEEARVNGRAVQEGWRKRKDGTKFWGSIAITALHDDDNAVIGFSKVTRDLTEKKLAEDELKKTAVELKIRNEALKTSEEKYHRMVAEVQDYAIILLDKEGNIVSWNKGAEKIKYYAEYEVIGKNFSMFYLPEDQQAGLPNRLIKQATEQGRAVHEGWRKRKGGTTFWGSISITALHDEQNNIIGFSKVTRDLTEKKESDDKLLQYTKELEVQNRELEQFAYIASHDLQEPLRKIQTFSGLIQKNITNEAFVRMYFDKINGAAKRMSELIRSVLSYSRLTTDENGVTKVDLNTVLAGIKVDLELLIEEKNVQVINEPLPVVTGNSLQLSQLFYNLLSNAIKFNDKTPSIMIKQKVCKKEDVINHPDHLTGRNYIEIKFIDNGIGFDELYEKQIFGMFQRLHGRHLYAGTGIGLALCKKIVDNHEGYIAAKSELGKGSTFYVYLPLLQN